MYGENTSFSQQSIDFIKDFFYFYLTKRDFTAVHKMLAEEISWFGVGSREVCRNNADAKRLLEEENKSSGAPFKIIKESYEAVLSEGEYCLVECDHIVKEDVSSANSTDIKTHATVVSRIKNGEMHIVYCHISGPNTAQPVDSLLKKSTAWNYNAKLAEELTERTQMLKEKTSELETRTDNIAGGIEVCLLGAGFPVLYVNDGMLKLTGYSREEIFEMKSHSKMIVEDDAASAEEDIRNQIEKTGAFSVEYRMMRKDGEIIWVLDRGGILKQSGDITKVQCLLVDITKRKMAEIALKVSEKRYEVAMKFSDVTIFEYNVLKNELILIDSDARTYGLETVVPNGPESLVEQGVIGEAYVHDFVEMYRKIREGAKMAECHITGKDVDGEVHDLQLYLVNIFDDAGRPIRAVGARKNVTQERKLKREQQYGSSLVADQKFLFEVNVTLDTILQIDKEWGAQIGAENCTTFSELKKLLAEENKSEEYCKILAEEFSAEALSKSYEQGEHIVHANYRKKMENGESRWVRDNINIIKDSFSGQLIGRGYIADIHEPHMKKIKYEEDKKLYDSLIAKSSIIYEINVTRDLFLAGNERWDILFGIAYTNNYSEMMEAVESEVIHSDDREAYGKNFSRASLLNAYDHGKSLIVHDYRRPDKCGNFIWVRCSLHLSEDLQTHDIVGRSYIEDINEEKLRELALVYKSEHDELTGLYNKNTVEKKIQTFLATSEGKQGKHAFLIIDIDYFKTINDNFGHAFGDATLSQVASKIVESFREGDFVGRIGGDEFVVFMKNISDEQVAHIKARELCNKIKDDFQKNGFRRKVSASIGIAFCKEHGQTYAELYRNSDTALYVSKEGGRDMFTIYNDKMNAPTTNIKGIDENVFLESRSYEENIPQYVFKILYEVEDKASAILSVLELMGKQFAVCRAYIFEYSQNSEYLTNTYEWCRDGVSKQQKNLKNIPYSTLGDYGANFNSDGIFFMPDSQKAEPKIRKILQPQNTKSMLQFSIVKNGKFVGFIGFDECRGPRVPTKKEVSILQNVSNILAVFILEMRASAKNEATQNITMSIINGLDSYAYVCDPNTHKILFLNERTREVAPAACVGSLCYESFWNRSTPCEECPMKEMLERNVKRYVMEQNNIHLNMWVSASSSWIEWFEGEKVCLVDSKDITKYKK